jgi:uncharacterized membrane-anchored protein
MKINWKQKFTSRKFICAIIGFVTAILTAFHFNDLTIEQIVAVITAVGSLAIFILGESYVDGKRAQNESTDEFKEVNIKYKE